MRHSFPEAGLKWSVRFTYPLQFVATWWMPHLSRSALWIPDVKWGSKSHGWNTPGIWVPLTSLCSSRNYCDMECRRISQDVSSVSGELNLTTYYCSGFGIFSNLWHNLGVLEFQSLFPCCFLADSLSLSWSGPEAKGQSWTQIFGKIWWLGYIRLKIAVFWSSSWLKWTFSSNLVTSSHWLGYGMPLQFEHSWSTCPQVCQWNQVLNPLRWVDF